MSPEYQKMKFASETRWDEFLKTHLKKTQRKARFGKAEAAVGPPAAVVVAAAAGVPQVKPTRLEKLMALKNPAARRWWSPVEPWSPGLRTTRLPPERKGLRPVEVQTT